MNEQQKARLTTIMSQLPPEKKIYPAHLYELVRFEIIWQLVLKEQYKLLAFLDEDGLLALGDTMIEWLAGQKFELAPFDNWWNLADSFMMGLKFKNIVPYITSENIEWQLRSIDSRDISLYWPVGTLRDIASQEHYDYSFVRDHVLNDPKVLSENRKISDEKSKDTLLSRDHFPIIVLRQVDGHLLLLDGNRRVMRSWLYGNEHIEAWVGQVKRAPTLYNHWVNTADLRRLLEQLNGASPNSPEWRSVRSQLEIILPSSSVARINFRERCLGHDSFAAELSAGLLE